MEDRIGVPLGLDGFEVVDSRVTGDVLEVEIRSTRRPACYHCGETDVVGHGHCERRVRDRTCVYPTVLVWRQRRVRCRGCGRTSRDRHTAVDGRRRATERFRLALFDRACQQPFSDVARAERVTLYRVMEAFDHHAARELATEPDPPRVVALDESAFLRRRRFKTVLFDPERRSILDMVDDRTGKSALELLSRLDPHVRDGIETAVIDCHWPYRRAIEALMPQARVVADKFHVLRAIDAAAQRVRVRHGRRRTVVGRDGGLSRQHNPRFYTPVWTARWLFMRRAPKLTAAQRDELFSLFAVLPEVGVAWLMKETFAAIYQAPDRAEAERRLDVWAAHLDTCGITEMQAVWRSLQWWRGPILNYFDDRQTNAFAEGVTNKIKVMKRRAYGFRNSRRYRHLALLQTRHRRSRVS